MNRSQIKPQSQFKNYYQILQIPQTASSSDIQNAYLRLSTQWHPDLFRQNKKQAQIRYNNIIQAYQTLSNKNNRQSYDQFFNQQYTIDQATKNFDKFYQQYGYQDEHQKKFFQQNYPDRKKHFYDILQLPKNATYDQIKKAYRKLAIKYHPKNNPGNQQSNRKFIQINRAYNSLANSTRKGNFDDFHNKQLDSIRTNNFFDDNWRDNDKFFSEQPFFGSPLKRQWNSQDWGNFNSRPNWPSIENWNTGSNWNNDENWRNGTNLNNDDAWRNKMSLRSREPWNNNDWKNCSKGQSYQQSTMTTNNNGVQQRKSVQSRKTYQNGQSNTITTEQHDFPDGTRQIKKTKDDGRGNVTTDVYKLKRGQNLPIGL